MDTIDRDFLDTMKPIFKYNNVKIVHKSSRSYMLFFEDIAYHFWTGKKGCKAMPLHGGDVVLFYSNDIDSAKKAIKLIKKEYGNMHGIDTEKPLSLVQMAGLR